MTTPAPRVGVLALQGDVREHVRVLTDLGAEVTTVRRPAELAAVDGLVLPGGESSVIDKLARAFDMQAPIRAAIAAGMPMYGTCAGLIMLADRITEGAAMIRSKGEAGTGDVSNATTHMRTLRDEIRRLTSLPEDELFVAAKELQAPYELVKEIAATGKLPVVMFTAGGIATPADAAMMMQLGAEGVFVGSGIFKSGNPAQRAAAITSGSS